MCRKEIPLCAEGLPTVKSGLYSIIETSDNKVYFETGANAVLRYYEEYKLRSPEKIFGMLKTTYIHFVEKGFIKNGIEWAKNKKDLPKR